VHLTATPYNEELIVQYLLGELPEKQQVEIEDLAFQDELYLQNILAVENDLIDEYVRGEIPPNKRQRFESHFLASAERRSKVAFARALSIAAESEAPEVIRPRWTPTPGARQNPFVTFFRSLTPVAAFSLATAALVLIFGATWLMRDGIRLRAQVTQLRAERESQEAQRRQLEEQMARERSRSEELAARLEREREEAAARALPREGLVSVAPASPSTIVALTLLPGLSRGSSNLPRLTINPEVRIVRLQVGIDPQDDYQYFRAELRTQDGKRILSQANLSARTTRMGRMLGLNLPAKTLEAGRFELSLKGTSTTGTTEDVGYYYFEVLKK
jgi:hypothetical protein